VLICGEAGIGKSRLVQALTEQIMKEPHARLACRGSMYHRQSALYPVIELLQRLLDFQRDDSPAQKIAKLEQSRQFSALLPEARACIATLLSLPTARFSLPELSPQRLRQKTLESLLAWLLMSTHKQPLLVIVEDVHWIDPSTVELLSLLIDQLPTARILALFTFRPEFLPPWTLRSHLTTLTLPRLGRLHVKAIAENVAGGKALPSEVLRHLESTTDGIPLFVEEFTKMIVESDLLQAKNGNYELTGPLPATAIPATLYDSLMARLDRLSTVKEIAQIGATIGREFPYEVLHAMSPLEETILQQELGKLVEADLLYQHGVPPQATYVFKHALLREAAYQSLLKSTRQQHHRKIAQVLAERFPDLTETQPELLAHHYTEADLLPQAVPLWLQAGHKAIQRFANEEAIAHLSRGRELVPLLPATPERIRQEIEICVTLGGPLIATKGYAAPEVAEVYTHARELSEQIGETPEAFPVLLGLLAFYVVRAELQIALALGKQALKIAERAQDRSLLLAAHTAIGVPLFWSGELMEARAHWEEGVALYQPQRDRPYFGIQDFGVTCRCYLFMALWMLGYSDQATKYIEEALTLAQQLSHPFSLAWATNWAARRLQYRRESRAVQQRAKELLALSTEYGFSQFVAHGSILKGWALADLGHEEEGLTLMRQGLDALRTTGAELSRPWFQVLLAETYGKLKRFEAGLEVVADALALIQKSEEWVSAPDLYRLRGEFLWGLHDQSEHMRDKVAPSSSLVEEAETSFLRAIEISRQHRSKSHELRASTSLARLWRQQGKRLEARQMLADSYHWFTEGFDTADLKEAKALLDELGQ
jgi:predicted ATPase